MSKSTGSFEQWQEEANDMSDETSSQGSSHGSLPDIKDACDDDAHDDVSNSTTATETLTCLPIRFDMYQTSDRATITVYKPDAPQDSVQCYVCPTYIVLKGVDFAWAITVHASIQTTDWKLSIKKKSIEISVKKVSASPWPSAGTLIDSVTIDVPSAATQAAAVNATSASRVIAPPSLAENASKDYKVEISNTTAATTTAALTSIVPTAPAIMPLPSTAALPLGVASYTPSIEEEVSESVHKVNFIRHDWLVGIDRISLTHIMLYRTETTADVSVTVFLANDAKSNLVVNIAENEFSVAFNCFNVCYGYRA